MNVACLAERMALDLANYLFGPSDRHRLRDDRAFAPDSDLFSTKAMAGRRGGQASPSDHLALLSDTRHLNHALD